MEGRWMTGIAASEKALPGGGLDGYLGSEEVAAKGEHAGAGLGGLRPEGLQLQQAGGVITHLSYLHTIPHPHLHPAL